MASSLQAKPNIIIFYTDDHDRAVISLDAIATALVAVGLELDDRIDGVDLVPYVNGKKKGWNVPAQTRRFERWDKKGDSRITLKEMRLNTFKD